ncbi:MAG: hypothetical protein KGD63_15395 [Candidatus Lokiarchaeota archaeon]|nr:hypothetical protein [Candidatus Lokiarchaeota archaeon]
MSSQSKLSEEKLRLDDNQKSNQQNINHNTNILNYFKENIEESFEMAKDLENILKNCSDLTNEQKSDYCKSQRYFMKQYLKKLNKKI